MKTRGILKNTAILGGGTGISQGLILAASPILTRIYSPEDFGILALYTAFLGILGGLSCLRYEQALPLAEDETEAVNIGALCGLILCAVVAIVCVFLLAFGDVFSDWLGSPGLEPYVWLIPVGVFAAGMAQTGRLWAVRLKDFKRLAAVGVISSVVILTIQFGGALLRFGSGGLVLGRTGGTVCSGLLLLPLMRKNVRVLLPKVSLQGVLQAARRHRQFPVFFTASSGINSLGQEMPVLFLSLFFGPGVTGLYALTRRALSLPMSLVGGHLRKVYYAYASDAHRAGDLQPLTLSIFTVLVQLALPATIIVGISAPEIFALVFGDQWHESGLYAQWLCPWLFMIFVCAPLTRLPLVMEKQGKELIFQIILLIMRALALVIGGVAQNVTLAFALFGGVSVLCWGGFLIWSMHLVDVRAAAVLRILARELAIAAPIVSPLIVAKFVILSSDDDLWIVAASVGTGLVAALVLFLRTRRFVLPLLASR